jgi:KDO2-lipid IV(A) lauroyltransferase
VTIACVGWLPFGLAGWLGARLGGLGYWLNRRESRRAVAHLALAFPDRPAAWHRRTARGVFRHAGRIAAEFMVALRWTHEQRLRRLLVNADAFAARFREDCTPHGAVTLTAHFGNWEVLGALGPAVRPLAVVARRPNDPRLARLADDLRRRAGITVVYQDDPPRPLFRMLRDGGAVGILADQDVRRLPGIFVPFFGVEAHTLTAPVQIAQASGATLRMYLCVREGRRYRMVWSERIDPGTKADGPDALRRATLEWTRFLEAAIRERPEQWMWMHRRWRTRPEDGAVAAGGGAA